MDEKALLSPMEVEFTAPADVKRWPGQWRYAEEEIVRMPALVLADWEDEMNMKIISIFQGLRVDGVRATLGAAWLALKMAGEDVAWADFTPTILLTDWTAVVQDEGKVSTDEEATGLVPDSVTLPGLPETA